MPTIKPANGKYWPITDPPAATIRPTTPKTMMNPTVVTKPTRMALKLSTNRLFLFESPDN